jgi:hypothetical protein
MMFYTNVNNKMQQRQEGFEFLTTSTKSILILSIDL